MKTVSPARRLEDRIRDLCQRVTSSTDGDLAHTVAELQMALREYSLRVHNKTAATVLSWPEFPRERRKA